MKHVGKSEMEAKSKIFFKWCLTKRTLKPFFLQPRRINVVILRWGGFLFYSPGEIPRFIFVREIDSSFIPRGKRSVYSKSLCDRFTIWFSIFSKEMWWLIGSAPDFLGRGPGFESGTSHSDCDALQDHCVIMHKLRIDWGSYPWGKKRMFKKSFPFNSRLSFLICSFS